MSQNPPQSPQYYPTQPAVAAGGGKPLQKLSSAVQTYWSFTTIVWFLIFSLISLAFAANGLLWVSLIVAGVGYVLMMSNIAVLALLRTNEMLGKVVALFVLASVVLSMIRSISYHNQWSKCGTITDTSACQAAGCQWAGTSCWSPNSSCSAGFTKPITGGPCTKDATATTSVPP